LLGDTRKKKDPLKRPPHQEIKGKNHRHRFGKRSGARRSPSTRISGRSHKQHQQRTRLRKEEEGKQKNRSAHLDQGALKYGKPRRPLTTSSKKNYIRAALEQEGPEEPKKIARGETKTGDTMSLQEEDAPVDYPTGTKNIITSKKRRGRQKRPGIPDH